MRVRIAIAAVALGAVLSGAHAYAPAFAEGFGAAGQFGQRLFEGLGGLRGEQGDPAEIPPPQLPDGDLAACHMLYTSVRREPNGAGWRTDYPWGQRHLLIRLSEITKTRVSWTSPGVPHSWLVRLTDDALGINVLLYALTH